MFNYKKKKGFLLHLFGLTFDKNKFYFETRVIVKNGVALYERRSWSLSRIDFIGYDLRFDVDKMNSFRFVFLLNYLI